MPSLAFSWPEQVAAFEEWYAAHESAFWWATGLSALTFVATLIAIPVLLVQMPSDYFVRPTLIRPSDHWLLRMLRKVAKNLLGMVLVIVGLLMFLLPGQGVLTTLIGLTLLDFPGKRQLELRIVRRPRVRAAIDWIRARYGRPPILVEPAVSNTAAPVAGPSESIAGNDSPGAGKLPAGCTAPANGELTP